MFGLNLFRSSLLITLCLLIYVFYYDGDYLDRLRKATIPQLLGEVYSPNSTVSVKTGKSVTIAWKVPSTPPADHIDIELVNVRDPITKKVADVVSNLPVDTTEYVWNIPTTIATSMFYAIRVSGPSSTLKIGKWELPASDPFTISNSSIDIACLKSLDAGKSVRIQFFIDRSEAYFGNGSSIAIVDPDSTIPSLRTGQVICDLSCLLQAPSSNYFIWNSPETLPSSDNYRFVISAIDNSTDQVIGATSCNFRVFGMREKILTLRISPLSLSFGDVMQIGYRFPGSLPFRKYSLLLGSENPNISYFLNPVVIAQDIPAEQTPYNWKIDQIYGSDDKFVILLPYGSETAKSERFTLSTGADLAGQVSVFYSPLTGLIPGLEVVIEWSTAFINVNFWTISLYEVDVYDYTFVMPIASGLSASSRKYVWTIPASLSNFADKLSIKVTGTLDEPFTSGIETYYTISGVSGPFSISNAADFPGSNMDPVDGNSTPDNGNPGSPAIGSAGVSHSVPKFYLGLFLTVILGMFVLA